MVAILALISSILFTPAFTISYFYETGVSLDGIRIVVRFLLWYNNFYVSVALLFAARARKG